MKKLDSLEEFGRIHREALSEVCFFARLELDRTTTICQGRMDRAHLIPAQRLRHNGLDYLDDRTWVYACRLHHHRFDHGFIRPTRADLPPEVEEYAAEHGIEWSLDRDYGEREAAA